MIDDKFLRGLPNKIALVHEWFLPASSGGAEKVVEALDKLLTFEGKSPDLFSLVEEESINKNSWLFKRKINTSFIQSLPYGKKKIQNYLPILPFAIEQLNLTDFSIVISSSHLVAKGVLTSPEQLHVSYVHTPARYAWDQMYVYLENSKLARSPLSPLIRWQLHSFRQWDQLSGARVDSLIANSRFTARRILKYWGRTSQVVHPPVSIDKFIWNDSRDDFYLCVCRLVPNKRVDLLVSAFNKLGLPLLIVGTGPQQKTLMKYARKNVKFLGHISDEKIASLMSHCRAFVYAGVEDFGIAPVEAMASGAPVICFGGGGLLDTVRSIDKVDSTPTGLFFDKQESGSIVETINWFEERKLWNELSSEEIRLWSERFGVDAFNSKFRNALCNSWDRHKEAIKI